MDVRKPIPALAIGAAGDVANPNTPEARCRGPGGKIHSIVDRRATASGDASRHDCSISFQLCLTAPATVSRSGPNRLLSTDPTKLLSNNLIWPAASIRLCQSPCEIAEAPGTLET